MRPFDKNHLSLKNCLGLNSSYSFLEKRLSFKEGEPEKPQEPEKKADRLIDIDQYKNEVLFQTDRLKTLRELARQDDVLAKNFEIAITESLDKQGYDKDLDGFWKEMETDYKCKKVEVKDGRIRFYDEKGVEVAPKFSVVPIIIDLSKFNPDTPRTKYYNPDTGIVSLQGWKETKQITVADIVTGARDGTQIIVTEPNKKPRTATFSENGKTAYYDDVNKNERVKIYDGWKVELVRKASTSKADEKETYGNYPSAGEYKFVKKTATTEGYGAEDFINAALTGKPAGIVDENNANLKKLRTMYSEGYKIEEYLDFLKKQGAIKKDRIDLLVDTSFQTKKEAEEKAKKDREKKGADTAEREQAFTKDREKYFIRENFAEDRKFDLKDPKIVALVDSPKKWADAWANDTIEGLKKLKGIIMSEPDAFGVYAKNPDALRERIRSAITNGKDDRIYFSDFINDIIQGRMPTLGVSADAKETKEIMDKQEKFSTHYERIKPEEKDLDQIKKAYGFLKKLGADVYDTATIYKTEGKSISLNLLFEGYRYAVKIVPGGALAPSTPTIQIFYFNTETPYYTSAGGYENSGRFKVSTLFEGDFKANNEVQKWFRDCVTPEMTYSRLKDLYDASFDEKGNPKPGTNEKVISKIRNTVIAGNRFLLQLQNLTYVEKATGEMGKSSLFENRNVTIDDSKFVDIIGDNDAWKKEWETPTRKVTKLLKQAFTEDPILIELSNKYPKEIATRIQDAVTNWSNKSLDIGDIMDYVLKGLTLPASQKPMEGYSDFMAEYSGLFDKNGDLKPGNFNAEAKGNRLKAFIKAANKLLIAFEGKTESIKETSELTYASQLLRNAKLESKDYPNTEKVFSADDVFNNYKGDQIKSIPSLTSVPNGVGLQIADSAFGEDGKAMLEGRKRIMFRAILEVYSLSELIDQGYIKRGTSSKLPNQEFYVINSLPDIFVNRMKSPSQPGPTYFDDLVKNDWHLSAPEQKEYLNPNAKLRRIAEYFFPLKESNRTYEDVSEGLAKGRVSERAYNRLDYTFAHTQFLKLVTGIDTIEGNTNAPINQDKMLFALNGYLALFDAQLDMQYGPDEGAKVRKEFTDAFGSSIPKIDMAFLDEVMKDPKKSDVLAKAVREGFVFAHDKKVETQKQQAIDKLKLNYQEWRDKILTEDEIKTLEKALRDAKVPENEIPIAIEKILPVWFGAGIDFNNGFGLAAGVILPIKLGKDGKYGTLAFGAGAGIGLGVSNGLGVGATVGIGYKTPNLGPFSLFAGGGIGVGFDSNGNFGVGGGFGAGVEINFGTTDAGTKVVGDFGLAYIPGVPFPIPGATLTFSKDHEVSLANLQKESKQKLGLDTIDQELELAKTPAEKKEIIGKNKFFRDAYDKTYTPKFNEADPETVVKNFRKYEANLDEGIRQNYDPALFGGISAMSFGFGWVPEMNKFIFGIGFGVIVGEVMKTVAYEGKGSDLMAQEIQIAHMTELAKRYNSGVNMKPEEISEVNSLVESGKLLTIPGSKNLAVFMPKGISPEQVPVKSPETGDALGKLEAKFNQTLKPLNMRVEYDSSKKLFEIKFNDWNEYTNYDIAVDSEMKSGGIVFDGGRIYLAADMSKGNTISILRADYEYPFKKDGKNYHSIITLSDSPLTPAHEIYRHSKDILSSKGGNWFKQQGLGYETGKDAKFLSVAESKAYQIDKVMIEKQTGAPNPDNDETKGNIDKLSITESEKGAADEKACTEFAKSFLKKYPIDYRKKSNKETETNKFDDLNKLIVNEWKKTHTNTEPNPAELNLIRLKIMDESFAELAGIKDPKAREKAFKERLETTEKWIILPRFKKLIDANHKKYPEGDSRRIRLNAEDLTRIVMARVKTIDVNKDDGSVLLSQIDRTSTVVGTLSVLGFRGEVYGSDNKDPDQKMIGAGIDYMTFLKDKPDSAEADIARLILEETSSLPKHLDITADTTKEKLESSKEGIYDLLRADLSQKIISTLFTPYSRGLFSEGIREEVLRLAANKDNLSFNSNSAKAVAELQTLVENIRKAETNGEKYYIPANAPDYRFVLNCKTQDGVYKKCTNYSMWINESIELQLRTSKIALGPDIAAAYGVTTGNTVTKSQMEYTTINIVGVLAANPPTPEGGGGGNEKSPKAPAKGEVDQGAGGPKTPPKDPGTPQAPDKATPDIKNGP